MTSNPKSPVMYPVIVILLALQVVVWIDIQISRCLTLAGDDSNLLMGAQSLILSIAIFFGLLYPEKLVSIKRANIFLVSFIVIFAWFVLSLIPWLILKYFLSPTLTHSNVFQFSLVLLSPPVFALCALGIDFLRPAKIEQ